MGINPGLSGTRHAFITLAAAAVLAGCSGSDQIGGRGGSGGGTASGGIGGTAGGEPLAQFASDFQATFCAPLVACGALPDLATCEAVMGFADNTQMITTVASVGRGTVAYDPAAAAACLAALPQDCTANQADGFATLSQDAALAAFSTTTACTGVFTGTVPAGGACVGGYSTECAPSAPVCAPANGVCAGACCPGVCGPSPVSLQLHALGEDCTDNRLCALPAVCNGTCVVLPGHLSACDSSMYPCGYIDDYCGVGGGATTSICLPRIAPGAPCTLSYYQADPCVNGAHCAANAAGEQVCVTYAALGDPCDTAGDQCEPALLCAEGVCTAIGPGMNCGG